jgi:hypothetical protein
MARYSVIEYLRGIYMEFSLQTKHGMTTSVTKFENKTMPQLDHKHGQYFPA